MFASGTGGPVTSNVALLGLARDIAPLLHANGVWIAVARASVNDGALIPAVALRAQSGDYEALDPTSAPPVVRSALARAASDQRMYESGNLATDPDFGRLDTGPFGALLCAPVYENGRPFVALVATRAAAQAFDSQQRELALVYARQIAMTLNLLDFAARHEAHARERAALNEANQALASGLDPVAIINAIASSIASVVAVDAALIYRFDPQRAELWLVTGLGVDASALAGATISLHDPRSLAARVASSQQPLYDLQLADDQSGSLTGVLAQYGPVWLICQPLVSQRRTLGVLMLARARPFERSEKRASERFVTPAAAALERAELFEEVRAQRDQRDAMFNSASDGMALIDGETRLVEVNQAFASYLRRTAEELRGMRCIQAFNEDLEAPARPERCLLCQGACRVRACLEGVAGKGTFEATFPAPTLPPAPGAMTDAPALQPVTVSFTMTPLTGQAGRQAMLIGRDITNERERERQRSDFLETLAHEVRQPLATAISNLDLALLQTTPDLTANERQRLERLALSGVRQAAENVEDLETLAQREFGMFSISPEPGDISLLAREVASELGSMARENGVILEVDAPDGLPLALMDSKRVRQVARNLLFNALKFTPRGRSVRIATRVAVKDGLRWAELIVADSGVGIPPESLRRIFERRFQVAASRITGRPKGSGMGLAVVRYIMEAHGTLPHVKSEVGKGSVFTVRFALA
ncbi:MAG TPA: ATP-binding protein [Ktedonobacterales bacterium]